MGVPGQDLSRLQPGAAPMKIRCPSCNKSARFPESEAGMPAVCTACGERYVVPAAPPMATVIETKIGADPVADTSPSRLRMWIGAAVIAASVAALVGCFVLQFRERSARLGGAMVVADATRPQLKKRQQSAPSKAAPTQRPPSPHPLVSTPVPDAAVAHANFLVKRPVEEPPPAPQPVEPPVVPRAEVRPIVDDTVELSDKQIGQSIERGVNFLLPAFNRLTHQLRADIEGSDSNRLGADILAVYALMQSGKAINDPRLSLHGPLMSGLIDGMKALPLENYHYATYARALRATALSLSD